MGVVLIKIHTKRKNKVTNEQLDYIFDYRFKPILKEFSQTAKDKNTNLSTVIQESKNKYPCKLVISDDNKVIVITGKDSLDFHTETIIIGHLDFTSVLNGLLTMVYQEPNVTLTELKSIYTSSIKQSFSIRLKQGGI